MAYQVIRPWNNRSCREPLGIDRSPLGRDGPARSPTAPLAESISALKSLVDGEPPESQYRLLHGSAMRVHPERDT